MGLHDLSDSVLLVLVGAGASHNVRRADVGGGPSREDPPLTAHLFDEAYADQDGFGWHSTPHSNEIALELERLGRTGRKLGFEEALTEIFDVSSGNPDGRAIKFLALNVYLARLCHRFTEQYGRGGGLMNTYTELVNHVVHQWAWAHGMQIVFVSVNYDELLERALRNDGSGPGAFSDYIRPDRRYSVVKMHGSCYWSRVYTVRGTSRPSSLSELLNFAPTLAAVGSFDLRHGGLGNEGWEARFLPAERMGGSGFEISIPALSLPFDDASNPKSLLDNVPGSLKSWLSGQLNRVVATLCIGWSGQDQHLIELLTPLTDHRPLWVVAPDADDVLRRIGRTDPGSVAVAMGFFDFVTSTRLDDFLSSVVP